MFQLLMRLRLRTTINSVRDAIRHRPGFSLALAVFGCALFVAMAVGFNMLYTIARRAGVLDETVYQVFYFLFLFLLAGSVPFVASTLLQSADYALLFASPANPRAVVAAKLMDATITNSLQFSILGIPAIVALAWCLNLPATGWLLTPLLVFLFTLLPALITALVLLLALLLLGMRRTRGAVTILNTVMALAVCVTVIAEAGHLPARLNLLSPDSLATTPGLAGRSVSAHLSPSAWFAACSIAAAPGRGQNAGAAILALATITVFCALLAASCIALGSRLLTAASLAEGAINSSVEARRSSGADWLGRIAGQHVSAIVRKDFRYLRRDTVLFSQLAMPTILYLVPFVAAIQQPAMADHDTVWPFTIAMIGIIVYMQTSIISLSSLGLEGQAYWILKASPHSALSVLWAKVLFSWLLTAGAATVLALISGVVFHQPLVSITLQVGVFALAAFGLCGLGAGTAAAFPRFVYENPAHRVSAWALILGFFFSTGFVVAFGGLIAATWFVTGQASSRLLAGGAAVCGAALCCGFTVMAAVSAVTIGARRLEVYDWQH